MCIRDRCWVCLGVCWSIQSGQGTTEIVIAAGRTFNGGTVRMTVTCDDDSTGTDDHPVQKGPDPPCEGAITGVTGLQVNKSGTVTLNASMGTPDTYSWAVVSGMLSFSAGSNAATATVLAGGDFEGGKVSVAFLCVKGGSGTAEHSIELLLTPPCDGHIEGPTALLGGGASGAYSQVSDVPVEVNFPRSWTWTIESGLLTFTGGISNDQVIGLRAGDGFAGGTIKVVWGCNAGGGGEATYEIAALGSIPLVTGVIWSTCQSDHLVAQWTRLPFNFEDSSANFGYQVEITFPNGSTRLHQFGITSRQQSIRGRFVPGTYMARVRAVNSTGSVGQWSSWATWTDSTDPPHCTIAAPGTGLQQVVSATLDPNPSGMQVRAGTTASMRVTAKRPLFAVGGSPDGLEILNVRGRCDSQPESTISLLTNDLLLVVFCRPGVATISLYDAWTGLLIQDYWPITVGGTVTGISGGFADE